MCTQGNIVILSYLISQIGVFFTSEGSSNIVECDLPRTSGSDDSSTASGSASATCTEKQFTIRKGTSLSIVLTFNIQYLILIMQVPKGSVNKETYTLMLLPC